MSPEKLFGALALLLMASGAMKGWKLPTNKITKYQKPWMLCMLGKVQTKSRNLYHVGHQIVHEGFYTLYSFLRASR